MVVLHSGRVHSNPVLTRKPYEPKEPYIIDMVMFGDVIAAAATTETIAVHDRKHLGIVRTLETDKNGITSLMRHGESTIISTSRGGKATLWDVRMAQAKAYEFFAPSKSAYLCAASDKNTLVLGTEATSHEVSIDQWDLRKNNMVASYIELHSDDITCLSFHEQSPKYLLSGAVDGLCAITDTFCPDPEEALVKTVNIGSSVHCANWLYPSITFSRKNVPDNVNDKNEDDDDEGPRFQDNILALTHIETLSISSADGACVLYDAGDVRKIGANDWATDYIVDVDISSSEISLLAGTYTGDLALISMTDEENWRLLNVFKNGHNDVIRTCKIDRQTNMLYSGGEDGQICCWSMNENNIGYDGDDDEMMQDGKRSTDDMQMESSSLPVKRARMF